MENNTNIAKGIWKPCNVDVWSDERLPGDINWWGSRLRQCMSNPGVMNSDFESMVNKGIIDDMIKRCRYLRAMPDVVANKMASAAIRAWLYILKDGEYDHVQLTPIDSYVIDSLERAASYLSIPALHIAVTPFSGRHRVTSRGELTESSLEVNEVEVNRAFESLKSVSYRPSWLWGVNRPPLWSGFRRIVTDYAKTPYYGAYRFISGDKQSYSFAKRKYQLNRMYGTAGRFVSAMRMEKNALSKLPDEFAFLPLQFYPEASSDYWIEEVEVANLHRTYLRIAETLSERVPIVVKEHPVGFGRRPSSFLDKLLSIKNVYSAPLMYPMGEILHKCSLVIGHSSTTSIQSMVMGKNILFIGTPFFDSMGMPKIVNLDKDHISEQINAALNMVQVSESKRWYVFKNIFARTAAASIGGYAPFGEKSSDENTVHMSDEMIKLYRLNHERLSRNI